MSFRLKFTVRFKVEVQGLRLQWEFKVRFQSMVSRCEFKVGFQGEGSTQRDQGKDLR